MVNAGSLRHRITIQQFSVAKDSYGEDIKTWSDYHICWAEISPFRGREYFESQQIVPEIETRMKIRYKSGIGPTMRVSWNDRYFDILNIINKDERNVTLEFIVKENPST